MAAEWSRVRVADIAKRAATGPFGSAISSKHFCDAGVPVIRGSNLSQEVSTRLDDRGLVFVSEEKAAEFSRSEVRPGDLVFTCWGTIDQVGLIDHRAKYVRYIVSNKQMLLTPDSSRADSLYLYYVFASKEIRAKIINQGIGSSVPGFNLGQLRSFEISLPPLAEQKAIAAVLGALDDKIELNRRMNVTLEAMARALFQSWFVDFDPVRAKLDGRQPIGLDEATAALFPATFQDSPQGHIPLGWESRNLSNLTEYLSRGIGPAYIEAGGICVLNQKCVREHRVDFSKSRRHDSAKKSTEGRTLQHHDVLVNSTGMGTLGRVAQVFHLPETTIVDSHVTVVRAGSETDPFFLGFNLTGREVEIEELGEGSTGQTELSRKRLGELKIITPPFEIQRAFGTRADSLLLQISNNETQSRSLATLRDTLLPKLLSGELSVASIESELEAVA